MFIGLGLSLTGLRGGAADTYAIAGFSPKLVFDPKADTYRTGGSASTFADLVTFTRAGNATYVDATGTLQTASTNVARRNHHVWNGSAWVNAGMLVEPAAATNLVTWSNDFTNAAWVKDLGGFAITTGVSGPLGSNSATTLTANSNGSRIYQAVSGLSATSIPHTASIWIRRRSGTGNVNWEAPGVGLGAAIALTGSWQRLQITISQPTIWYFGIRLATSGDQIDIWGAQLEAGSVPSSYVPTTVSAASRAAETVSIAAAKLPYSATAMSIAMRGRMTYADTGSGTELDFVNWTAPASNIIRSKLATNGGLTGGIRFEQFFNGTADVAVEASPGSYSPGINVPFSIASRHGSTFINGAIDGTALTVDLTPTSLPNLSATPLSLAFSGGPMIIEQFAMWDVDLADAGIEEASA